ncbi:ATP synthase F1 subunit delta [Rhabdothermincola salaria]|uniref:ATP synthase F1 subunit delta n=1 Tax=Rhabdothermincola salaria TaxID=2903142 RepID=UPI001E3AD616|nr:ATP synthase F1 subunit delta [Rhabdothermincola salaria]MCD9625048.1 ATP synthase F1 subunit delta [Rhabdothermincola salaria]
MSDRIDYYAQAFHNILLAEGSSNEVTDELFRFARILEGNDELRTTLSDVHLPVERRQQIVEDLLGGKATPTTTALVALTVATGRVHSLTDIVGRLLDRTAATDSRVIAQVRSAVPLTEDQKARLAEALAKSIGKEVDIVVIIDPEVLGGLVTQIGDTVIDGSVRQRLSQLRESF